MQTRRDMAAELQLADAICTQRHLTGAGVLFIVARPGERSA